MEQFWRSLGVTLGKRWVAVLIGMGVVTAILAVGAAQLEFATGQDSYLDDDSQVAIDNRAFQNDFGGETLILLFQARDGADISSILSAGDNLAAFEELEARLRDIPEVYSVVTPLTSLRFSEAIAGGPAGTAALADALAREPDPEGRELRQADLSTTLARRPADANRIIGTPSWDRFLLFGNENVVVADDGTVTEPDGDDRVVRLSLQGTFPNLETAVGGVLLQGNADLDSLSAGTEAVLDAVSGTELDGFDILVTGSPVFLAEINDYLQGGMLTLGAIALVVMAVILALLFQVRWRFLPLLSTIVGVAWGFSLLGWIGIDLSLVTISGLPILIGLGIDFVVQVHNRVEEETALDRDPHPIAETLANIAPVLVAATAAAVVAFLALQVSQVPMIRDFGVMLAIGIVTLVFCGIVLPTAVLGIREYWGRTLDRPDSAVERIVVKLGSLPTGASVPLVAASVVLFVAGVALEGSFDIESDPVRWIDQDSQTVEDLDTLEEATGFASTLGVLVEANNVLTDEVVEVVHDFTLAAEARSDVVASTSLTATMAKIIAVPGATPLPPTSEDVVAAAEAMPPDIALALLRPDRTATQINLRLAPGSLEERAVVVEELSRDLEQRIDALDLPSDSVLLTDLDADEPAIRAVPAGLAVVGVGLLENLSANRALLTYLGLALVGLVLLLRFRSLGRAVLTLVPVGLAIGTSSVIVGAFGLTLSPLTTVSGPLVIASCTEFSVLITARYLEERQAGRAARDASEQAARRTGRAFFTSAATTIGGFAVLIGSALPLLRDFGIIVTLNVAVALLAALVVMPPLLVWADDKGLFPIGDVDADKAVVLAARPVGARLALWLGGCVVFAGIAAALLAAADRDTGASFDTEYVAVALPTTTTTTTTTSTVPADEETTEDEGVDLDDFPSEAPEGLVQSTVFNLLTAQGADPRAANCTHERLLAETDEGTLINLAGTDTDALFALVDDAATECGVPRDVIDAATEAGL